MDTVSPADLTDDDFLAFSRQLRQEMDHLDGREWQEAQDLRDECHRGRVHNSLTARIRVARALNARRLRERAET
jgi:hypothetical protein